MNTRVPEAMIISSDPPGTIYGLKVAVDVSGPKRFNVTPGVARDDDDTTTIRLPVGMMKRLDQTWAAGSGNGALDTGTIANSTWYHLHLMRHVTTGAVDILASGSLTNPLMPAGWEAAPSRRFWSIATDGSANIYPFIQIGDYCEWTTLQTDYSGNIGASTYYYRVKVPDGLKVLANMLLLTSGTGVADIGLADPDGGEPIYRVYVFGQKANNTDGFTARGQVFTDINGRVMAYATANINSSIQTLGYWDSRGKD